MKNYNKAYFEHLRDAFLADENVLINPNTSDIHISIQNGPIQEHGVNGTQIDTIGKIWLNLLQQFNAKFPCRENSITITKIEEALMWQQKRTENRTNRNVEGTDVI